MVCKMEDLKKDTLPKTYENLNRICQEKSKENLLDIVKSENASNSFEKSMKLIVIDSLQSKEGVLEALMSEDPIQIRRALKCKWFFEDSFTSNHYETEIFPKVSYSTRCKIITQLAKNIKRPEEAEHLFEFLVVKYGKKSADTLLPRCSSDFICSYIDKNQPKFSDRICSRIFINIAERYPDIVLPLVERICLGDNAYDRNFKKFEDVILYFARHHPEKFIPFFENHYEKIFSSLHFGFKLTRKFSSQIYKMMLTSGATIMEGNFKRKYFYSALDSEEKINFLACMIESKDKDHSFENWNETLNNFWGFLSDRPDAVKLNLLELVFKKVYKEDFWDHPELWRISLLETLPLDKREWCVKILSSDEEIANKVLEKVSSWESYRRKFSSYGYSYKKPTRVSSGALERSAEEKLVYLMRCEVSIPKLKETISKAPDASDRETLILEMVNSCAVNKDLEHLKKVCEYVVVRHRNEDKDVITSFLDQIEIKFGWKQLNLEICTKLEELATIILTNSPSDIINLHKMMENHVLFLLENDLCAREQARKLIKFVMACGSSHYLNFVCDRKNPCREKYFYLFYEEFFKIVEEEDCKLKDEVCFSIVRAISNYNKECEENSKIQTKKLEKLLFHLDKFMEEKCLNEKDRVSYMSWSWRYKPIASNDPFLSDRYNLSCGDYNLNLPSLNLLLKKDPEYLTIILTHILDDLFSRHNQGQLFSRRSRRRNPMRNPRRNESHFRIIFTYKKKIFDFVNVSNEIKRLAADEFKSSGSEDRKLNALKIYSFFAEITEYENLVKEYEPKQREIDYKANTVEFAKIQLTVPELIKNIKPDSKNFIYIFKYMQGDFLKPVLTSFHSACYNSPIDTTLAILQKKLNAPVSAKKNILRYVLQILTLEEKIQLCIGLWDKEKHHSIRSVILSAAWKVFQEKPNDHTFGVIKKFVSESDEVTFESRPAVTEMPDKYIGEYALVVWQMPEKLNLNAKNSIMVRNSVIDSFGMENIGRLPDDFCRNLIRSEIFKDSKLNLYDFTCYYLISDSNLVKDRLALLLDLMRERKENKTSILSFLDSLQMISLDYPKHFHEIFEAVVKFWEESYSELDSTDEFITFKLYKAYHKILSDDELNNSVNLANELKELIAGTPDFKDLFYMYRHVVGSFLKSVIRRNNLDFIVVLRQLMTPFKRELAVLSMLLLQNESYKADEIIESGDFPLSLDRNENIGYMIHNFKNCNDRVVQMYWNRNKKF